MAERKKDDIAMRCYHFKGVWGNRFVHHGGSNVTGREEAIVYMQFAGNSCEGGDDEGDRWGAEVLV